MILPCIYIYISRVCVYIYIYIYIYCCCCCCLFSYSRGSSWPRDQTHISWVSCTGRWILYLWATREATQCAIFSIFVSDAQSSKCHGGWGGESSRWLGFMSTVTNSTWLCNQLHRKQGRSLPPNSPTLIPERGDQQANVSWNQLRGDVWVCVLHAKPWVTWVAEPKPTHASRMYNCGDISGATGQHSQAQRGK